jgi:flavin reductase (DIM6/NTAB) family NADH-FMN oxidoreductase RutF
MRDISTHELESMDRRFRANFINSISGFKSANLIATISSEGVANLAIFSSVIHIGANPPMIGMIMRPITVERHTYTNIIDRKFYTINSLPLKMQKDGHRTSAKYSAEISEFDQTDFTAEPNEFDVPYVKESPVAITCELKSDMLIELNQARLIIGQVRHVKIDPRFLREDGYYDMSTAGVAAISGMDGYHEVGGATRYTYARPNESVTNLQK